MNARSATWRAAPTSLCLFAWILLVNAAPAAPQDAAAAIKQGQAFEAAEKFDLAIAEYSKAIAADPASAVGWLRRGWARFKAKAYAQALEDLDRAVTIDPSNAEAHKDRAAALSSLLRFKEAVEAATRALELQPGYSAAYFYRGLAKFRLLDFGGAVDDETLAIDAKPDNWDAMRIRGLARVELKKYREALGDLDLAIEHNMLGGGMTHHYRAIARHALSDTRGALDDENRTLELNPAYAKGYAGRGIYKAALGDRTGAEADYRRALALDPNERAAASGMAKLGLAAPGTTPVVGAGPATTSAPGRSARAASATPRAALPPLDPREVDDLSRFPNEAKVLAAFRASPTPATREALARVRFEHALRLTATAEKQLDEHVFSTALAYAESAAALAPDNVAAWLLLGRLYASLEDNPVAATLAEQALMAALELKPSLAPARLALAQLYFRRGSYDRALGELEPAVAASPALAAPEIVSMMGWAYVNDFQLDRGIRFFRGLSDKNPKAEPLAIGLAVLLHENGARADAERALSTLANNSSATAATRDYAKALLADWAKGGAR